MQKSLQGGRINMVKNVMQTRLHNHMVISLYDLPINFNGLKIDGWFYNSHFGKNVHYIQFVEVRRTGF